MNIAIAKDEDGTVIIDVTGTVNINTAPKLHGALEKCVDKDVTRLIIRLAHVDYMDSSGVGVLVSAMKLAMAKQIPYGLCEPSKQVNVVIEMTRLNDVFQVFPTLEEAKRCLKVS